MSLLIVDDYAPVRETFREVLDVLGLEILEAEDGEEALRIIGAGGIDVVLLDLYMPGCDGLEVLRRLSPPHPRMIVVSAFEYVSEESLEREVGERVWRILRKPVMPQDLRREVESALAP